MKAPSTAGFTIVELMVVVTTLGILSLLGLPSIRMAHDRTEATATANDLRILTEAIEFYSSTSGSYPETMTYSKMPADIAEYLPQVWKDGGHNWFYYNDSNYTYIYLYNLEFSAEQAIRVDAIMDDGNITSGDVRVAYNGSGLIYLFRYKPPAPPPEA